MTIILTGVAGFIGFHVARSLLDRGEYVIGIDNLNHYYEVSLKQARLDQLNNFENFEFKYIDICNIDDTNDLFEKCKPEKVVHLAAQAGVRYSLINPAVYTNSNLVGFTNILEACRHNNIKHLVYASSSSVYGANKKVPFSEDDPVDQPISFYGATKRANELMAYTYSYLYGLPTTGIRFFTVYGPYGRPDMSYYKFVKSIINGQPIDVFNKGRQSRDFTYIDDIVDGVLKALDKMPAGIGASSINSSDINPVFNIYNMGSNNPIDLMDYIAILERIIGNKANINMLPDQPGDMAFTFADIEKAGAQLGFDPKISIEQGLENFVQWYREYYGVNDEY
jgi:UDP-glucuronate 4-epimerase